MGLEMVQRLAPHCHLGPCSPSQSRLTLQAQRKLRIACVVCFLFMIGEVIGQWCGKEDQWEILWRKPAWV